MNRTVVMRDASPADADLIRAFVCGLSPRSQYFRFFASVAPPSTSLLRMLCGGTKRADVLIMTDSLGTAIGHGMAADVKDLNGLAANIGLVIADRWQGQGLGTLLLSTLVSRAAARGVGSLVLDVLPANDRMRGIIARRWPDAPVERTRDAIIFRPAIAPAQAATVGQLPSVIGLACRSDSHAPGRSAA
jgi:GNAT superfamily N-acetyltransferase